MKGFTEYRKETLLCSKYVYKTKILNEAVKRRSRKNSKLNYIDYNEKLKLEKFK